MKKNTEKYQKWNRILVPLDYIISEPIKWLNIIEIIWILKISNILYWKFRRIKDFCNKIHEKKSIFVKL